MIYGDWVRLRAVERLGLDYRRYARLASPSKETLLSHKRILETAAPGVQWYLDFETSF